MQTSSRCIGRLAPSPTGLLHLGNVWAFLLAWLAVRKQAGSLILRLEDIDPARSKEEYRKGILEDLAWLGLSWDEGPDCGGMYAPYVQSERHRYYQHALDILMQKGCLYPCFCTRKEIQALAQAPNGFEHVPMYPGLCRLMPEATRQSNIAQGKPYALRVACEDRSIAFLDRVYGSFAFSPKDFGGDFAVRRSDGVVSYQLAVAVDDGLMGVTQIVRGRDILPSTAKQLLLQELLSLPSPKEFAHMPLLLDEEGERFAKRHKSLAVCSLRAQGVKPWKILGFLGHLAGLLDKPCDVSANDLVDAFQYEKIPREDIRLTNAMLASAFGA